jgi:hypothetical protein
MNAHDPRWHLGQCIVWIATRDLAAVERVAAGHCVVWLPPDKNNPVPVKTEVRSIIAAVHREKIDSERAWYDLIGRLGSGALKATGVRAGRGNPEEIEPSDFHDVEIGYSMPGSAPPHLYRKRGMHRVFDDVRILRDHLTAAFPARGATEKAVGGTSSNARQGPREAGRGPGREAARRVLKELYPDGIPDAATVRNGPLCDAVKEKLPRDWQHLKDDTILRAAGRKSDGRRGK